MQVTLLHTALLLHTDTALKDLMTRDLGGLLVKLWVSQSGPSYCCCLPAVLGGTSHPSCYQRLLLLLLRFCYDELLYLSIDGVPETISLSACCAGRLDH
jgi:hypothetical protein